MSVSNSRGMIGSRTQNSINREDGQTEKKLQQGKRANSRTVVVPIQSNDQEMRRQATGLYSLLLNATNLLKRDSCCSTVEIILDFWVMNASTFSLLPSQLVVAKETNEYNRFHSRELFMAKPPQLYEAPFVFPPADPFCSLKSIARFRPSQTLDDVARLFVSLSQPPQSPPSSQEGVTTHYTQAQLLDERAPV